MKLFKKKITVPESNKTKEVETIQLWYVIWYSRYGSYSHDLQKETEAFTSKEGAREFAESLTNAFTLIKHTCGNGVCIKLGKEIEKVKIVDNIK